MLRGPAVALGGGGQRPMGPKQRSGPRRADKQILATLRGHTKVTSVVSHPSLAGGSSWWFPLP